MHYFAEAGVFLVSTVFYLYLVLVLLRFLLQLVRADFYNPISQFLVKVTSPALRPLRRFIPGYAGVDLAAVVLMLVLKLAELWLLMALTGLSRGPLQVLFLAVGDLLNLTINLFIFTIFVEVLMSWINPGAYNPATALLFRLNEPLLRPVRRRLPSGGGLDLSPLFVLLFLSLAKILVVGPIHGLAGGPLFR